MTLVLRKEVGVGIMEVDNENIGRVEETMHVTTQLFVLSCGHY